MPPAWWDGDLDTVLLESVKRDPHAWQEHLPHSSWNALELGPIGSGR